MTLTEPRRPDRAPAPSRPATRPVALVAGGLGVGLVVGSLLGAVGWDRLEDGGLVAAPAEGPAPGSDGAAGDEPAADSEQRDPGSPPAGSSSLPALSWAPPELDDPEVVRITAEDTSLELDQDTDYELVLPDEPLEGELSIYGGRDVVMIGGEISVPEDGLRALYLRDQTGTVHVEGVKLSGEGLGEGINLDQRRGAVVQLQNIWVGEVYGELDGHHGDLIQSWAGPAELRVDGLTGSTGYQGFFLLPGQFGDQPPPTMFDLRRVDITGAADRSAYMLWRDDDDWPLVTDEVWVAPTDEDPEDRRSFLWDREGEDSWEDVEVGRPPGGSFVPEDAVGTGYTSPGYAGGR